MTFAQQYAADLAEEALDNAVQFERDLLNAFDHAPDDFTGAETAALNLLMACAANRVKMRRSKAF